MRGEIAKLCVDDALFDNRIRKNARRTRAKRCIVRHTQPSSSGLTGRSNATAAG
jgi:hypothetical protein